VIIGLDTKDGAEHALYDPRINLPIDEAMVLNIMANGVIELIECRMNGTKAEVVNGRRRVRHAREANKRLKKMGSDPIKVGFTLKRGDDARLFGIAVSANEHREDDTPMAKAEKLQRLLDLGASEDDAAIAFGVTKVAVKQWLKLLDLSAYVKKLVDKRQISASAAAKFADLDHDEQKAAVDKLIEESGGKKPTTKKAASAGKQAKGDEGHVAPGKRVIKKVIENAQHPVNEGTLTADEIKLLRWVIGDIGANAIKGLTALTQDQEEEEEEEEGGSE
jgi:ParB family chromosome partitioning protein